MSYENFRNKIKNQPKIDTHEHYPAEQYTVNQNIDFFNYFVPYICDNLLTAGMPLMDWVALGNKSISFEDRWKLFEPYIDDIKHTTYFRALMKTYRDCYGLEELSLEQAIKVSEKLTFENKSGIYAKLNKQNNVESVFSFVQWNLPHFGEDENMYPVPTVSDISIRSRANINTLSETTGVNIFSLDSLLKALTALFDMYKDRGYRAVKFGNAYTRKLDFDTYTAYEAENVLNTIMSEKCTVIVKCVVHHLQL